MFAEAIRDEHEYRHTADDDPAYNESTYYNFTSPASGVVGWLRVAVQDNQPSGQATALVFLPSGEVLFSFRRTPEFDRTGLAVGPVRIDVVEPHRRQRLTFDGRMSSFEDPRVLSDPRAAFAAAPRKPVRIDLDVHANGAPFGTNGDAGQAVEGSLAVGHYEQFVHPTGTVEVDGQTFEVRGGGGLRDHSWGPRDWTGPLFHRWISASLEDGTGIMAIQVGRRDGGRFGSAALATAGTAHACGLTDLTLDWTPDGFGRAAVCELTTPDGDLTLTATARSPHRFVPLRHVKTAPDGTEQITRIGYSSYEFTTSDGRRGLGTVEMLDQLVDGRPAGQG